ncbi:MAG: aldo/keto reductase, partial [Betaproteobacteria bacterium]|nr:aldo/keto reductase [Betaproteobacteria bacterium]
MAVSRIKLIGADVEVSRFIVGFWRLGSWGVTSTELQFFVEELVDLGVTTMDHAFVYRSEALFGEVLKKSPALRNQIEIVTKFGIRPTGFGPLGATSTNHYDSSSDYLRTSVENSLRELNTDRIDILLVHRPDYLMDVDKMAVAFETLMAEGKVRSFGVSNFSASQFSLLQSRLSNPLVTNQVECSPLCLDALENGVLDQCQQLGVNPMFWSCLAGGELLTGEDERSKRVQSALNFVAEETGANSLEQVVYSWLLKHPSNALPII